MARQPRFSLPGQLQHIIQKGNNRQDIFYSNRDYRFYLDKLAEKSREHKLDIHAYVLMPNHTHILATPRTSHSISKALQSLGRCYAQYFNHTHDRTGTLFEGRYRATLVDSDTYLFHCYRYIESNPLRAGLTDHAAEYLWSSHQSNAFNKKDSLITYHPKYLALSNNPNKCASEYRKLFKVPLDDRIIEEISESTNKSWVLGSKFYKNSVESLLNRRSSPMPRGGDRKSINWNLNRL